MSNLVQYVCCEKYLEYITIILIYCHCQQIKLKNVFKEKWNMKKGGEIANWPDNINPDSRCALIL
jgi:hypothetical protein